MEMALWLVKGLLVEYIVIAFVALLLKDMPLAYYFVGSAILTIAIIMMRQG